MLSMVGQQGVNDVSRSAREANVDVFSHIGASEGFAKMDDVGEGDG